MNSAQEDMQDFLRDSKFRKWDHKGGPGPLECWGLEHPNIAIAAGGGIVALVSLAAMGLTGSVVLPAAAGILICSMVGAYILHSDQVAAERALYREWIDSRRSDAGKDATTD